jgi:hypothetical protein
MLKERVHKDYASQLQNVLTSVKGVNKTNVMTLSTNFGVCILGIIRIPRLADMSTLLSSFYFDVRYEQSFKNLAHATPEQLALCPGLGDIKVRRLYDAFNLPFKVGASGKSSKSKPTAKAIPSASQNSSIKGKEKATMNSKHSASHDTGLDEQLTLSDVGLSMGLADDNDSRIKKRKRPSNEVVIIDDEEEDTGDKNTSTAGQAEEGSPDWPDLDSENGDEESESVKKVWKDPLSLSDDDD